LDSVEKVLTSEKWVSYQFMFEECGMEVYEATGAVRVETEEESTPDNIRTQSLLELRGMDERLHSQLYAVHEIMEEAGVEQETRVQVVDEWMAGMRVTVESLLNAAPEDIVEHHGRPWEM
jgi:hypothetical protein